MIVKIDHIGIAVNSIEKALKLYTGAFGIKAEDIEEETVEEQKTKGALISIGESKIELVESVDPEGPIARHIEKRGEGMQHLALEVSDIQGVLKTLKEQGIPLIDTEPRIGVGGSKVAFIHPRGAKALIELVEH